MADIVSADNQILTFLSGLGFPFTILYGLAVLTLLVKLIRMAFRPPPGFFFPPLALLFPLAWPWCTSSSMTGCSLPKTAGFSTSSWA